MGREVVVVHGGAGAIERRDDPVRIADARAGMTRAVARAVEVLSRGGSATDAAVEAVVVLEDDPVFNAGRGGVLNERGEVELDASLMSSRGARAGAVSGFRRTRNPIRAARWLHDDGVHVFQSGALSEAFLQGRIGGEADPGWLVTAERTEQLARTRQTSTVTLDHGGRGGSGLGTVGAVVLDARGDLAAATSTGGMTNKRAGRVSDSAVPGAGTWAEAGMCAVSTTGHGEYFLRAGVARGVAARMRFGGASLGDAAEQALTDATVLGGTGGLIAVGADGAIAAPFHSGGMFRAWSLDGGPIETRVWADD